MSTIRLTGRTEKKLQKRVPKVAIIQTNVFLAPELHTRTAVANQWSMRFERLATAALEQTS